MIDPLTKQAQRAFGASAAAIKVEICRGADATGTNLVWDTAGSIIIDRTTGPKGSHHGAFLYREGYDGPAISPSLDPRQGTYFPLQHSVDMDVRSKADLHPVFLQALPDEFGTRVLNAHLPEYANADASGRLSILASHGDCRVGALRFDYTAASLEQHVVGMEALERMNGAIGQFMTGGVRRFLDRAELWSVYSDGGAQPKVAFKFNRDDQASWVAKLGVMQAAGAYDQPKVEAACMAMARDAGVSVPVGRLMVLDDSGASIFMSARYDERGGVPLHRFNGAVALGRPGKYEYATYTELANVVQQISTQPEVDRRELFGRMLLNAYLHNTDDHLGQVEFVAQPGGGYRLAPAIDIQVDDGPDRPHMTKFAGGQDRPEHSVAWIQKQAAAMGIERTVALEIASRVVNTVAKAPEYFDRARLSIGDAARVTSPLRLGEVAQLAKGLTSALEAARGAEAARKDDQEPDAGWRRALSR